uniref:Uncharacterized protein n=1 Tax=Ascaris lumbricoides TaxID=6252 RepID=A0A0M3IG57_ASCLU
MQLGGCNGWLERWGGGKERDGLCRVATNIPATPRGGGFSQEKSVANEVREAGALAALARHSLNRFLQAGRQLLSRCLSPFTRFAMSGGWLAAACAQRLARTPHASRSAAHTPRGRLRTCRRRSRPLGRLAPPTEHSEKTSCS